MKKSLLISSLLVTLTLVACDKPTVVNVPPSPSTPVAVPVPVPGPAGPQGEPGKAGQPGQPGDGTTVVIVPPASAPSK
ncbi:MAG: hypothetical protein V4792_11895 [Pseudomonadota bacterium]